jgi:hypothetical protein
MVSPILGTAATLGLTVGAGYLFGPAGAVAGALLGGFLFGSGGPNVEGPRLGDLTVGASTYGNVIPVAFATQKIAGTIIWAPEIEEVKNTGKVGGGPFGGLFGGGQKVTEYRYYASFAVAFAEGPATGLVRLWAGDKLIADLQAPDFSEDLADGAASMRFYRQHSRYKFQFYRGTSTQQPDPLIRRQVEDELGESHITPGFRDIVYIVFDRLALDEFGNRVPPITAEIAFDSDSELPERKLTSIASEDGGIFPNTQTSLSPAAIDWERGYIYLYRVGNTLQGFVPGIRRYRVLDGVEDLQAHSADITTTGTQVQPECVDHDGNLYCRGNTSLIVKVSGETLREIERHSSTSPTLHTHIKMAAVSCYTLFGRETFLFTRGGLLDTDVIGVMNASGMLYVYDETVAGVTDIIDVVGGIEALGYCEAWAVARTGGMSVKIIHVRIDALAAFVIGTTVGISRQDFTVAVADIDATATSINDLSAPAYAIDDDAVIFSVRLDSSNGPCRMVKYSVAEGIVWSISIPSTVAMPARTRFSRGVIGIHFDDGSGPTDGRIFLVDTALGEVIYSRIGWDHDAGGWQFWHDLSGQIFKVASHLQIFPERVNRNTVALSSIVTSLCARVGLETDDIDVTELNDGVQGFGIARQITIRGALELLAAAYNFDGAESDDKLRFKKRGRVSSRVIAETELAPVNNQNEMFIETRAQDIDLPLRFTVRYNDSERDAEVATQTAKRIAAPTATMQSANEATLDLPITLTPTQAKNVALRQCFGPWSERTGHQWKLPWTHLDLDPGDVVTFALTSGRSYVVRILEMAIGADLSIEMQTVTEQSASYDVDAVTSGGLVYRRPIASPSSTSRLIIADTPLLSDHDDVQRLSSGLYWFMGGLGQPAWPGGTLFQSEDGASWALFDESVAEMAWGLAANALGDTATPFQTDRTNSLIVRMLAGASRLNTVTELEMLNGANRALLVDSDGSAELIQFATATANGDGTHTLSTLLRGRRGTELFTGGHSIGSVFVLIEDATLSRALVPLMALGATRYYRPLGRGDALRDARTSTITPAGLDLMPYAPVQIAASGSWGSEIILTWQRRTRIGGELIDGGGDVPLAEDSEAYELEILLGETVVRTVEGLTSQSYAYSAVDQASDFAGYIAQEMVNPGFETGDLTGWTTELDGSLTVDDAHESLTAAHGGSYFLRSTADSRIAQTVDVTLAAEQIDTGNAQARARCWIAETATDTDAARVALQFLDENDVELGVVEPSFTNPTGQIFAQIEAEGAIPVGTRQIKVRVAIDRVSGSTANVAVDDVTLAIDPGDVRHLTVAAYQISGQVGRGFRGLRTVDVA